MPIVPHHQWILLQNVACYRSNVLASVSNFDGQDQSRRIVRPILQGISCSNVSLHAWQFAAVAVSGCTGAGCYGSLFDGRHAVAGGFHAAEWWRPCRRCTATNDRPCVFRDCSIYSLAKSKWVTLLIAFRKRVENGGQVKLLILL